MRPFRSWGGLFISFVAYRRSLVIAAIVVVLASAAAEVAFPWLLQLGVDSAIGEPDAVPLITVAALMTGLMVFIVLGHGATLLIETWLFSGAAFDLRHTLYDRFQRLSLQAFSRQLTGTLTHRATTDVGDFEDGMIELFSGLIYDLLVGIGVLIAMSLVDLRLTALVTAIMLVATASNSWVGRSLPVYARLEQMLDSMLAGRLQESLGAARTVRGFGAEAQEVARLDAINTRLMRAERRAGLLRSAVTPLWHFAEGLGIVALLGYGGSLVADGTITIGAMVGFMAYMELLAGPITRIGGYYAQFQTSRGVAERIVDLVAGHEEAPAGGTRHGQGSAIAVQGVGFQYPGAQRWALRDVSFDVAEGECVAVIGRNGSGKSTLFDLLLHFQEPNEGRITAGGVDLAEWDSVAWHAMLGFMPQETVLFHATLAENIAFGRPGADRAAIQHALEEAGGGPLLSRLPRGLDTLVGERGQTLSGGERQMVGLARLFLRDPRILLLDEPTAALDGEALRLVDAALRRLAQDRTTLLITHLPETLTLASRILVLDAGQVVAIGSPDALRASQPLFRKLVGETTDTTPATG